MPAAANPLSNPLSNPSSSAFDPNQLVSQPKWARSRELLERARQTLAGGVSSPFRAKAPIPLYIESGQSAWVRDVDGNDYLDYLLAWGPAILGHAHAGMAEALRHRAGLALCYGMQHELEIEVAGRIHDMVPCAERVAFTSSGSEALQIAMRLARAYTGRSRIVKFEGHYHGWMDTTLWSYHPRAEDIGPRDDANRVPGSKGQSEGAGEHLVVLPWNDADALRSAFHRYPGEIAAVLMEPVLCNSGCILPRDGYLAAARDICSQAGALLLFDEVITGFRMHPGGAQAHFGVIPDLATFGKAVGGGMPLSVVAGRAEILDQMFTSGVAFGGTFNGNPLCLAGANAALAALAGNGGAALRHANAMGEQLKAAIASIAQAAGIRLLLAGFGAAFAVHFTQRVELFEYRDTLDDDPNLLRAFLLLAADEGVLTVPDGRFYVSAAHTPSDVAETISRLRRAFTRMGAWMAAPGRTVGALPTR